ncbi:MAG: dihydropteroate synthase [Bryobacterales bacterium]|jgi:dihydropteroate synthase|nr:dihydropteroate synthase [Bryobacterales bacterium]
MPRKRFRLELKKETLYLGDRTLVFSLLKLPRLQEAQEPFRDLETLVARAHREVELGADVIDVSAMSLSPTVYPVSAEVEARSVVPMVRRLRKDGVPYICVTTTHGSVAEKALQAGADFINDPSGLKLDPELGPAVSRNDGALILAHMREIPPVWQTLAPIRDPLGEAFIVLRANLGRAIRAGIPSNRILVDPGLGLGKRKEENTQILAQLRRLQELEYPTILTFHGKTFVGDTMEGGREAAESAAAAFALSEGVHAVRTPSAAASRSLANVVDALMLAQTDLRELAARKAQQRPRGESPLQAMAEAKRGINRRGSLPPLRPRTNRG